jgi:hypothetical protein
MPGMYKDHPVMNALLEQLRSLNEQYNDLPNELNRYRVVRQEQLIAQWAPGVSVAGCGSPPSPTPVDASRVR